MPILPAYVRKVCDHSKSNAENIKKVISCFNWNKALENLSIDAKVELLNETLLSICRNYIPNEKIMCDYRSSPWMNDNIKRKLRQRTKLTKHFYKNGQINRVYDKILEKSAECTAEILEAKRNYILNMISKLADSHTAPKNYWALLNRLLYNKKTLARPPLLVDRKFIFHFYENANILVTFLHQYVLL